MGFLDRLIGSDTNLKRPSFAHATSVNLNIKPCSLRFKNPDHTAMYPINVFPEDFDLFESGEYEAEDAGDYSKLFYVRGWDMFGRKNIARGGVGITGRIFYFPDQFKKNLNLMLKQQFLDILLYICHDSWSIKNKAPETETPSPFNHPRTHKDFSTKTVNNHNWTHFQVGTDGAPPRIGYALALTEKHILYFEFKLSTYRGLDFYSPETNMKEAAFGVVDEFMSHVEIRRNSSD